jgi:hypothetical protein
MRAGPWCSGGQGSSGGGVTGWWLQLVLLGLTEHCCWAQTDPQHNLDSCKGCNVLLAKWLWPRFVNG